ncbi:hypothetical protein ACHIPZ_25005 [Antrihabitans sp. NCIMB 15449]|uniref:Uncharacterized protein n=1 Tax=Antrihabitans spumae TaxID=3373370 RepID=A0ABW7JWW3_9NOCA
MKLPPGSTVSATEGIEVWETPEKNYWTSFGTLREQLPVGEQFEGLTWCDDDVRPPNFVQWTWGDAAEMIVVAVNKDGQIQIIRGPDTTGFGCY